MISRAGFLSATTGLLIPTIGIPTASSVSRSTALRAARKRKNTLAYAAAQRGILFGTAAEANVLQMDPQYANEVIRECSLLVPEGSLKARETRKSPDGFDFSKATALLDFASENSLAFRGHTLIWNLLPGWVEEKLITVDDVRKELVEEVTTPMRHFRGRIDSWDVVNESINVTLGLPGGLNDNFWYRKLGQDYISIAFRAARDADPHATLVLNENGIELDTPENEKQRRAVVALLKHLKATDVPIDALGIEAHLGGGSVQFNSAIFSSFLTEIEQLGLKIIVTELDVSDKLFPADISVRDSMVAEYVGSFLRCVLGHSSVITVGVWGLSDRHSWISNYYPRADGLPNRPSFLDANLERKPSYEAAKAAFLLH